MYNNTTGPSKYNTKTDKLSHFIPISAKRVRTPFHQVNETPQQLMQKRLNTYILSKPSPITVDDQNYDIEMGGPKSFTPIRSFSPITSPYMSEPYIQNKDVSRSYSPVTTQSDYMKSLDDSNLRYDDDEWGIHDKNFSGGKRRRLTKKQRKSKRISRTKRMKSRRRTHASKTRK